MKKIIYSIAAVTILMVLLLPLMSKEKEADVPVVYKTSREYVKSTSSSINTTHSRELTNSNDKNQVVKVSKDNREMAVIGSTLQSFESVYGDNTGDNLVASFDGDYILPIFVNGEAWNIDLQFTITNKPNRSKEEAIFEINKFLPADAKEKRVFSEKEKHVIEYQSDSLAEIFSEESFKDKPGTFTVILKKDKKTTTYSSASIVVGINLKRCD